MLGKAVHSLSRIGDELYLEPLEDGVRGWSVRGRFQPGLSAPGAKGGDHEQICLRSLFPRCWSVSLHPVAFPGLRVHSVYLPSLECSVVG